ncbi:MAG: DUF6762 family protein [Bacillota bacterium]
MDNEVLVLMQKNNETGFLEKEIGVYTLDVNAETIFGIFATEEDGQLVVSLSLTCQKEISDWEYDAIFDYYDTDIFVQQEVTITEKEGHENPMWCFSFPFIENQSLMEEKISALVTLHEGELLSVYDAIVDKKDDYIAN